MSAAKIEHTQKFSITSGTTAAELKTWLGSIPGNAKVSVSTSQGDWHHSDTHSLTASWSTAVGGSGW
jgi:hypothetical protein